MSSTIPSHEIPILLTSSVVAHDTRVRLKDTDERIRLAMESVDEWLRIDPRQPIVLCDGSSFDFSAMVQREFPSARVECLHFENNQELVQQHGRGYGEGEIVRYAMNHSRFIHQADCFAKCSSKLWVENFHSCANAWQGKLLLQGVFLGVFVPFRSPILSYIDTRFYIANRSLYREYFENAHLRINKSKQYGLENAFLDIFLEARLTSALTPVAPVICGVGGAIAKYYKNTLKRRLKERLRLILVKHNHRFRDYFIQV